ncbi:hypothetical protein NDU88_005647 [Pleurodeles waltl]|uniref:Uncharacterized protein n=1 Tax=Pleurodeles waltl TaxID=8319 RepID=A0AAV7L1T5_PLEWA|nr:hypothetical protein NDU88_005647 [Pleurodeles waltl]
MEPSARQPAPRPSRDPDRGRKGNPQVQKMGGARHDPTADQALQRVSTGTAPGALQDSPGALPICLRSLHQEGDADLRRPPTSSLLGQLRPGQPGTGSSPHRTQPSFRPRFLKLSEPTLARGPSAGPTHVAEGRGPAQGPARAREGCRGLAGPGQQAHVGFVFTWRGAADTGPGYNINPKTANALEKINSVCGSLEYVWLS